MIFINDVYFNIVYHFKAFNDQTDGTYKNWNARKQFNKKKDRVVIFMFVNRYVHDIIL